MRRATIWGVLSAGIAALSATPVTASSSAGGEPQAASPLSSFVGFEEPQYQVDALATTFRVRVVLEPVPQAGLISYGVTLKFDAQAFDVAKPGIEIPAPLDFNGLQGPGAFTDVGPGYASVKGTVDLMGQAAVRYDASLLASFVLIPKDLEPGGAYELVLEPFYTVGPDEALYVTGEGGVLDAEMVFGRASLEVIPEPG
ncbi:MAG: hypothetical protein IT580_14465, partial [Verrucomicrobiales bacterium]|nr:hypothetical protein [Verrucomicrobiales bacterium]